MADKPFVEEAFTFVKGPMNPDLKEEPLPAARIPRKRYVRPAEKKPGKEKYMPADVKKER